VPLLELTFPLQQQTTEILADPTTPSLELPNILHTSTPNDIAGSSPYKPIQDTITKWRIEQYV